MSQPNTTEIVLTDGFEIFGRQTVMTDELDDTLRDLNARPPRWRPQEPSYRPPLEVICDICGAKHCINVHGRQG